MTHVATTAAEALSAALTAENAALDRLDFAAAGALVAAKSAAAAALLAATQAPAPVGAARDAALAAARRLDALAAENKRLLERAMDVQARVIGLISRAAADQPGPGARGYGAAGVAVRARARPMALVARA